MSSAKRDDNREVALILQNTLGTQILFPTAISLTNATPMHVAVVDASGNQITSFSGAGNANGQATMANSAPVVIASDQSAVPIGGTTVEVTGSASSLNADAIASMDVRAYKTLSLHITSSFSGNLEAQGSNDNSDWRSINLVNANDANNYSSSFGSQAIWYGVIMYRYFRLRMTSYTSGTGSAVAEFNTQGNGFPIKPSGVKIQDNNGNNITSSGNALDVNIKSEQTLEMTGTATATGVIIASTDVSNYKSISVHSLNAFSGTYFYQGSNDGTTWENINLFDENCSLTSANFGFELFHKGNLYYRYFRINVTSYTSGTINLKVEFYNYTLSLPLNYVHIESGNSPLITSESAPMTVVNGKKTVTTSGTRVALASTTTVKSVTIKALAANTGTIYVGSSTVSSSNGFQLAAGDTVSLDIADLATVNIDSSVNGEGVSYIAIN